MGEPRLSQASAVAVDHVIVSIDAERMPDSHLDAPTFPVWPEDILAVLDNAEDAEAALARMARVGAARTLSAAGRGAWRGHGKKSFPSATGLGWDAVHPRLLTYIPHRALVSLIKIMIFRNCSDSGLGWWDPRTSA